MVLSERQLHALVAELNRDHVNLPFVSEEQEHELIETYARKLAPHVGPALEVICGTAYSTVLTTALDEKASVRDRRRRITRILKEELSDPLVQEINATCDVSRVLPERTEAVVLKVAVDSTLAILVRWVIGELDEQLEESYTEAAAGIDAVDRGASFESDSDGDDGGSDEPPAGFLSDRQVRAVVNEMNQDVNIPFLNEEREGDLLETYVTRLNPHFGTALEAIGAGTVYATATRVALNEKRSLRHRRRRIAKLLRDQLSEPLTTELNERVDFYDSIFLSDQAEERIEHELLQLVVNKMISRFAHWILGELDEKVEESLAEG